jgi:hypothetical protein
MTLKIAKLDAGGERFGASLPGFLHGADTTHHVPIARSQCKPEDFSAWEARKIWAANQFA